MKYINWYYNIEIKIWNIRLKFVNFRKFKNTRIFSNFLEVELSPIKSPLRRSWNLISFILEIFSFKLENFLNSLEESWDNYYWSFFVFNFLKSPLSSLNNSLYFIKETLIKLSFFGVSAMLAEIITMVADIFWKEYLLTYELDIF